MRIGGAMFFTDYSMSSTELARALEERGFDSLWVPEHSHIPLTRNSPFPSGGDLPKKYYDVMDPFVVLGAAAAVTKTLLLGTGICLIAQRDPIQTAKQVASIDQVSGGRFLFGIGNGWNEDEMANHGTVFASRHKLARERIEAMKEIWTKSKAEYHGEFVNFDPMMSWPKPVQKPYPPHHRRRRLPVRRAARLALRRRLDAPPHAQPVCGRAGPTAKISVRWQPRRDATPRRYRSRSGAPRKTLTCSSATETTASHAWLSAWIPLRPIRSCRNSTAGRR
jgi:probable F420-dependent oxidoreductase